MNIKSILLGAAAAAAAATGAQAADLPVAPEPVDYVRICDAFGTGFFYIPGTETCLRVGGRIRTEFRFNDFGDSDNSWDEDSDISTAFRARGYIRLDSRTNTEFGLLRTYLDLFVTNTTGSSSNDSVNLDKAFIQFGGLTAGRTTSFYDFYTGNNWGAVFNQGFSDNGDQNLFGYTYAFGNGFSVSVSAEDGTDRRRSILGVAAITGTTTIVTGTAPTALLTTGSGFGTAAAADLYGGHKIPDFVANLRVDQGWGSAQIMGALHHVYYDKTTYGPLATAAGGLGYAPDSELGWAIGAGVTFNVPMLAPGDYVGLQASYSQGAVNYAGNVNGSAADGVVDFSNGDLDLTDAWQIGAGFTHFWTPTLNSSITASYISIDHPNGVQDLDEWNVQGNIVWNPVSGLDIGAEVEYYNDDYSSGIGGLSDKDAVNVVLRVQRTF
ncbi:porin [Stappia sp. F7233]|uniref:Porin n=1 Tax=Stappia albiluteola TaxID=2758565 RepID=A0A839AA65_9HYPH|nr:porin [Stappia albiluteola]MBA5775832.1 porin [Stappia albiluteola]